MTMLCNVLAAELPVYQVWFWSRILCDGFDDMDVPMVSYLHLPVVAREDERGGVDGTARSSGERVSPGVFVRDLDESRAREPAPQERSANRALEPVSPDRAGNFLDLAMETTRAPQVPMSGARILHGDAMGMERPREMSPGRRTASEVRRWAEPVQEESDRRLRNGLLDYYQQLSTRHPGMGIGPMTEVPEFSPAGVRFVTLLDGRQTHALAENLLAKAGAHQRAVLVAYTLDHPYLFECLTAAARRGVAVEVYQDYKNLLGASSCVQGAEQTAQLVECGARARAPGSLQVMSQRGLEIDRVNRRYGRRTGPECPTKGALHAKVFLLEPYLIVGSANWSVASESNHEAGVVLQATTSEAEAYFQGLLCRLTRGAVPVSADAIRSRPTTYRSGAAKNRR